MKYSALPYSGFSLVELSIVLVVLGLLTGGILTGQSLIRASELRAIPTEFSEFQTATHAFKNKYFFIPGDMPNATSFWGDNNTHCPDAAIPNGTPGTCNGNGDNELETGAAASQEAELFMFWNHLAAAGLLSGQYDGIAGSSNWTHSLLGTNVPESKMSGGGWFAITWDNSAGGEAFHYQMNFGDILIFGASTNGPTEGKIITPTEAWNIDKKVDDGRPAYGNVIAVHFDDDCAAANDGGTAEDDFDADYRLTDESLQCALLFRNAF